MFLLLPISVESGRLRPPFACIFIAAVCAIAFAGTWLIGQETAVREFAILPSRGLVQIGWLSSMFVHYGWLHLLGNMLFFYLVAPLLEDAWGSWRLFALYVVGGLASDIPDFFSPPNTATAGASGAIAACMGAFVVRFGARNVKVAYVALVGRIIHGTFQMPAWVLGGLWAVTEVYKIMFGSTPGIANGAHVAGFTFGLVVALTFKTRGLDEVLVTTDEKDRVAKERRDLLTDGKAALDVNDLKLAREKLEQLFIAEPQNETAEFLLGELDLRTKKGAARWERNLRALLARNDPQLETWVKRIWSSSDGADLMPRDLAYDLALRLDALTEPLLRHAAEDDGPVGAQADLELAERANDGLASVETGRRARASLHAREGVDPQITARLAELEAPPPKPKPSHAEVVPVKLKQLDARVLELATATQVRSVPFERVAAVHAGFAPMGRRQVLLIDLVLKRDEGDQPLALRLTGDDELLAELTAQGLIDQLVAAGATRLPKGAAGFPRFEGPEQVTASWARG